MMSGSALKTTDKKNLALQRNEYRRQLVDLLKKEYKRAFDAIIGGKDIDLELVVHSMSS